VILETTGLADPAPVAFTFFANPWIASRYRIDSIVCVCDTQYALQVGFRRARTPSRPGAASGLSRRRRRAAGSGARSPARLATPGRGRRVVRCAAPAHR
jgi:hypothetical protein